MKLFTPPDKVTSENMKSSFEGQSFIMSLILTLSVGELLSERVGCDDEHPLDPPEQNNIIALQLEKG